MRKLMLIHKETRKPIEVGCEVFTFYRQQAIVSSIDHTNKLVSIKMINQIDDKSRKCRPEVCSLEFIELSDVNKPAADLYYMYANGSIDKAELDRRIDEMTSKQLCLNVK